MSYRLRKADLLAVFGVFLILSWVPAYVAFQQADPEIAGNERLVFEAPRDGERVTFDAVVTRPDGRVFVVENVIEQSWRLAVPGEVPVDAYWVEEMVADGGKHDLGTDGRVTVPDVTLRWWYDASGRPVWQEKLSLATDTDREGPDDDDYNSLRFSQHVGGVPAQDTTLLNQKIGMTLDYQRDAFMASFAEGVHAVRSEFGQSRGPDDPGPTTKTILRDQVRYGELTILGTGEDVVLKALEETNMGGYSSRTYYGPDGPDCGDQGTAGSYVDKSGREWPTVAFQTCDPDGTPGKVTTVRDWTWDWYAPGVPSLVGGHVRGANEHGRELFELDVVPAHHQEGHGEPLPVAADHLRSSMFQDNDRPMEPLADPLHATARLREHTQDQTPLVDGVSMADIREHLASDEAPSSARVALRDGAYIVDLYIDLKDRIIQPEALEDNGTLPDEGPEDLPDVPETGLPVDPAVVDEARENTIARSSWYVTLGEPANESASRLSGVYRLDIERYADGDTATTRATSIADLCDPSIVGGADANGIYRDERAWWTCHDTTRMPPADHRLMSPAEAFDAADAHRQVMATGYEDIAVEPLRLAWVGSDHVYRTKVDNAHSDGVGRQPSRAMAPQVMSEHPYFMADNLRSASGGLAWIEYEDRAADDLQATETDAYEVFLNLEDGQVLAERTRLDRTHPDETPPAPNPQATALDTGLIATPHVATSVAVGGASLTLLAALARLGHWLALGGHAKIAAVLYAKIAKDDVLDHDRREAIVELLRQDPGMTPSELAQTTGAGWGATMHHLTTLHKNGYVTTIDEGRKRHYFLLEQGNRQSRIHAIAERTPQMQVFVAAVAANPGTTLKDLTKVIGRGASGLSRTGRRLEELGLVEKRRDGMSVRFWVADQAPGGAPSPDVA